jgi:hypothetical protein
MNVALKEWSAVITALDCGAQIFLLRKGGIVEARHGFQPKYAEFLLFPTFEHQHARYLKPERAGLFTGEAPESHVHITHLALVTDVLNAPEPPEAVQAIRDCHVWNDDFIRKRYEYRPDLPLYILAVRAYRLDEPHIVPMRPSYAGCKSWVHLAQDIPASALHPVVEDDEFCKRRMDLLGRLNSRRLKGRKQPAE